jgi:hypothetical protein
MRVEQDFSDFFSADGSVFKIVNETALVVSIGGSSLPYIHVQSSPSTLWTVNHNLGYRPVIDVLSVGGIVVEANVTHVSDNQAQINFNAATGGSAICQ